MRHVLATVGLSILALACVLITLTCERPVSPGGPSDNADTTSNIDIQGEYYGYLTTDYHTLNRRTVTTVHVTVTPAASNRNGCTCVYDITVADSIATLALICAGGKSSRLIADCTDTMYHDIFLGSGNGSAISGILERYKLRQTGSEYHWCTMSFSAETR